MKKIYLTFVFGLIIVITFSGCTTPTTIISEVPPQITTSQIGINVIQPTTTSTTQVRTSNAIAIVQNMSVVNDYVTGNGYVLDLSLTPTSLAIANTQYTVSLYDEGTYRDSTTLSWDQNDLNINYSTDITFPISENEYETYQGKDLTGVFSITVSPTTSAQTTATGYTPPYINLTSPEPLEDWYVGENVTITWTTTNIPSSTTFNVYLVTPDGIKYLIGTTLNTGSFNWVVTDQVLGAGMSPSLQIPSGSFDENVIPIEISFAPLPNTTTVNGPVFMTITSPKNGAAWKVGDTVTITWTSTNLPSYVYVGIDLYGGTGNGFIGSTINTGSFNWVVTNQVIGTKIGIGLNCPGSNGSQNSVYVSISN